MKWQYENQVKMLNKVSEIEESMKKVSETGESIKSSLNQLSVIVDQWMQKEDSDIDISETGEDSDNNEG